MAELLSCPSNPSLLLLQQPKSSIPLHSFIAGSLRFNRPSASKPGSYLLQHRSDQFSSFLAVSADSTASTVILAVDGSDTGNLTDTTGGGGGAGDFGDSGGGGNGGGGGGGSGDQSGEESEDSGEKKTGGMSMSQKLTLGYAALVGVGGLMGYMKSGSQKSLVAGGVSASILYFVYTQLPTNPVFASSIGLGISAALLGVMGSRFMRSGKIFPAGVVSLMSFVMTGGYLHGILRSMH